MGTSFRILLMASFLFGCRSAGAVTPELPPLFEAVGIYQRSSTLTVFIETLAPLLSPEDASFLLDEVKKIAEQPKIKVEFSGSNKLILFIDKKLVPVEFLPNRLDAIRINNRNVDLTQARSAADHLRLITRAINDVGAGKSARSILLLPEAKAWVAVLGAAAGMATTGVFLYQGEKSACKELRDAVIDCRTRIEELSSLFHELPKPLQSAAASAAVGARRGRQPVRVAEKLFDESGARRCELDKVKKSLVDTKEWREGATKSREVLRKTIGALDNDGTIFGWLNSCKSTREAGPKCVKELALAARGYCIDVSAVKGLAAIENPSGSTTAAPPNQPAKAAR